MDKIGNGISSIQLDDAINEMNALVYNRTGYRGIFGIDNVDDLIKCCKDEISCKSRFFWCVYNSEPSHMNGQHWRIISFFHSGKKYIINIFDSLGGESLVNSYPNLLSGIKTFQRSKDLTNLYNNPNNDELVFYKCKISKSLDFVAENEEKYFIDILKEIFKCSSKNEVEIRTFLNKLQKDNTPTCGLYCLFFVDIGFIPLTKVTKDKKTFLKNQLTLFRDIFKAQTFVGPIRSNKDNESNIRAIYERYIEDGK